MLFMLKPRGSFDKNTNFYLKINKNGILVIKYHMVRLGGVVQISFWYLVRDPCAIYCIPCVGRFLPFRSF